MNRKAFIYQLLASIPVTGLAMNLKQLSKISEVLPPTPKTPVLFLGHGSPMNAIEENEFVKGFRKISTTFETPKAILCISAHWETRGTQVTAMQSPRTIHDFGGFPQELFEVQYPAPGSPELAQQTQQIIQSEKIILDESWGLDHGAWSVIKHLYPKANIPVIQMSLDHRKSAKEHYAIAKALNQLRSKGILIVGSGNIVHNLRQVAWNKLDQPYGYDWALEVQSKVNQWILDKNHDALINFNQQGKAFQLAIPTPEHYLPLLYTLALQEAHEQVTIFNDQAIAGSLTMTSLKIG
ncbi:MAG: 4,5-DOPA dioxygenase extradiol [Flavobacteriales bacterium]|jgi:4,5-DOPA dioxygenase extradiol|nr:4,5-DOPA dioxygenase extradiol [Flavobacteriales bacterium]